MFTFIKSLIDGVIFEHTNFPGVLRVLTHLLIWGDVGGPIVGNAIRVRAQISSSRFAAELVIDLEGALSYDVEKCGREERTVPEYHAAGCRASMVDAMDAVADCGGDVRLCGDSGIAGLDESLDECLDECLDDFDFDTCRSP